MCNYPHGKSAGCWGWESRRAWRSRWSWVAVMRRPLGSSRESVLPSSAVPLTAFPGIQGQPSLSPDGSQVAFTWNGADESNFDIYVKLVTSSPKPVLAEKVETLSLECAVFVIVRPFQSLGGRECI